MHPLFLRDRNEIEKWPGTAKSYKEIWTVTKTAYLILWCPPDHLVILPFNQSNGKTIRYLFLFSCADSKNVLSYFYKDIERWIWV